MEVCIASVPHTGTTFTENLFKGWENRHFQERGTGNTVYRDHIYDDSKVRQCISLLKSRNPVLIIPLRHPFLTEESWRRKGKDVELMIRGFQNLFDLFAPREPYYMPVDSKWRVWCFEKLRKGIGVDLETDWQPARSISRTYDLTWRDCEPSFQVKCLAKTMHPLLDRFYD